MQLASDAAAKPPSPDRVFEAASVVPISFCSSTKNPEFLVTPCMGVHSLLGVFAVAALNS